MNLVKYDAACQAIAEAFTLDEAKEIHDKSVALLAYAKQMNDKEHQMQWAEVAMRAERRWGQIYAESEKAKGTAGSGNANVTGGVKKEPPVDSPPTLAEMNVTKRASSRAQKAALIPDDEYEETLAEWRGRVSKETERVTDILDRKAKKAAKKKKKAAREKAAIVGTCTMMGADVRDDSIIEHGTIDAIITDPPYPKEYLPLYADLARNAALWLKPDGICVVMCGQSYLPEIYAAMGKHLIYIWTFAYTTPGGQAVQIFPRKVNAFWKPILVYGRSESLREWAGDVASSAVNDNDKDHHHWGQSESGMADLIKRLTAPGDLILDPFLGGGTTVVVAAELGRNAIGFDIDPAAVESAKKRIA